MGILDSVFAGKDGITNYLHGLLGGTAYFSYKSDEKPVYNIETAEYEPIEEDITEPFPFIALNIREVNEIANDQNLVKGSDITGSIPYSNITLKLRENVDKFTYNNKTYIIIRLITTPVGDQENRVIVCGRLVSRG